MEKECKCKKKPRIKKIYLSNLDVSGQNSLIDYWLAIE
jgi:hypothetical protein